MSAASDWRGGTAGDTAQASPVVPRLLVGLTLRRVREALGLSSADAGQAIGIPVSDIIRLELGRAAFRMRDVAGLCTLYGITDLGERSTLLGLARRGNRREWWHSYRDIMPGWFEHYLELEQAASLIRTYEAQFVPGLLQTPDYATAVLALTAGSAPQRDIDRKVELRLRRQDILYRPHPPLLWTVIDEAALHRLVGNRAAMRAQLRHLIDACDMPHIRIQILAFHLGVHPATRGPVAIVRLPDQQLPDVVYLEQLTNAAYPTPAEVTYYRHLMDRLAVQAAKADPAQVILSQILNEI